MRGPIEMQEHVADRIAGERRVRKWRIGQRHRGARSEADAQPVRETGCRVLLVHDHRDAQESRREHARERRVAAETDDDTRAVTTDDRDRAHHGRTCAPDRPDILKCEPTL